MINTKVLAIYGSSCSGKTTTSVKLATLLSKQKKNVIIVSFDSYCPTLPYILNAETKQDVSLGELLTKATVIQNDILKALVPVPNNDYISLLGYKLGESARVYPKVVSSSVATFMVALKPLADFIILDLGSQLETDVASLVGLQMADVVLRMGTADLKSLSYFHTIDNLLLDSKYDKTKELVAISNVKSGQEWENVSESLGGAKYVLPNALEIEKQTLEVSLFESLKADTSIKYMKELSKLAENIFHIKSEKTVIDKVQAVDKVKKGFKLPFGKSKGEF